MRLIEIGENGIPVKDTSKSELIDEIRRSTRSMYTNSGFVRPWIGFLAEKNGKIVGTCAFKSPPQEDKVEIAYFTFPEHEGKGIATEMAEQLIKIARNEDPEITITAQTLPKESASTTVLKKNGFKKAAITIHPVDGPVWEWELE